MFVDDPGEWFDVVRLEECFFEAFVGVLCPVVDGWHDDGNGVVFL
jgi:hypothetical protein